MCKSINLQVLARTVVGLCLASAGLFTFAPQAQAGLIINVTFDSTITSDPNAALIENAINQAMSFYETAITTPITVGVKFAEMGSGLGQSSTFVSTVSYSQYLAALQSHSSGDAVDTSALATLPAGPNNPVNGTTQMDLTTANLRALGFNVNPPAGSPDSTISLNTSITNYAGKAFDPNDYDLIGVVQHEFDEALSLGSDLDSGSTTGHIRSEDLFRYAAPGVRSFTTSSAATSYFSVDGGVTNLVGFNQAGPPGGSDYGDWVSSGTVRVQDAFGTPGATPIIGIAERTALDATGYNFALVSTPEPSSFWLLAFGAIGFLGYRIPKFRINR
jgi:hypothetical protein